MTCREVADFLMDYLNGELPEAVRVAFEQHLSRCPDCVNYLDAYKAAVALGRRAFAPNEDDAREDDDRDGDESGAGTSAPEDLIKAILDARRR